MIDNKYDKYKHNNLYIYTNQTCLSETYVK